MASTLSRIGTSAAAAALAALFATHVLAQQAVPVWHHMQYGPPLTATMQQQIDISRSVTGIGSSLQVVVNGSCFVLYTDRPRNWTVQAFGSPYYPCAKGIFDPHVAYYESGAFGNPRCVCVRLSKLKGLYLCCGSIVTRECVTAGHSFGSCTSGCNWFVRLTFACSNSNTYCRWFITGYYNSSPIPGLDAQCVNATLQSYELDGSTCGGGSWLQHSFNPPFARHDLLNRRVGYYTRFAAATGPVILGGHNSSTGQALSDVWVNCRSFFDCPNLGWRRGDDVPEGCASPEHRFIAFSVDDTVFILCGSEGPDPGPSTVYYLRTPGLHWIKWGDVPAGSFSLPLRLTQIEQLNGPDDVPPGINARGAAADDGVSTGRNSEGHVQEGAVDDSIVETGDEIATRDSAFSESDIDSGTRTSGDADISGENSVVNRRRGAYVNEIAACRESDHVNSIARGAMRGLRRNDNHRHQHSGQVGMGSITAKGGCVVAIAGGEGYAGGTVSTSYDGLQWQTHPAPYGSRSRVGFAYWRPNRMAVMAGLDADGVTYHADGWYADVTLCCATSCDVSGNCVLCSGRGDCAVDAHQLCYCQAGWAGYYCEQDASSPTGSRTPSRSPTPSSGSGAGGGSGSGSVSTGLLSGVAVGSAAFGSVLTLASLILLRSRGRGRGGWGRLLDAAASYNGADEIGFSTSASLNLADGEGGDVPATGVGGFSSVDVSNYGHLPQGQ